MRCVSVSLPLQLFTKPHPARTTAGKASPGKDASTPVSVPGHPQPFLYSLPSLRPSQVTVKGEYLALLRLVPCPTAVPSVTGVPLEVQRHRPRQGLGG